MREHMIKELLLYYYAVVTTFVCYIQLKKDDGARERLAR